MIKILHAADFHLDSPFHGLSPEQAAIRREEHRKLVREMVELSNLRGCEIMLLSGDLFDGGFVYPDTIEVIRRAFSTCRAKIFIAPGNHDCCAVGSPYLTETFPENVHIFRSAEVTSVDLPDLNCRVYGAAFTGAEALPMLSDFHAKDDGVCNLMVVHGDPENAKSPYNPITRQQIAASGLSYLALGHIHAASGLQTAGKTAYAHPGCPMGRGFDETGEKGAYIVEIEDGNVLAEFLPLPGRRYEILEVAAGEDPLAAVETALPGDVSRDCYRILLRGESDGIDVAALLRQLQDRFFSLTIRDETHPPVALWSEDGEDTLKGLTISALRAQYDRAQTDEERRRAEMAARYCLAAMDRKETPIG